MLRNTQRNEKLRSPAERLFSRKTRTTLPTTKDQLKPEVIQGVSEELRKLRIEQGIYADRVSNPMKPLEVGDQVRLQKRHREWVQAKVEAKTEFPRSVIVKTTDESLYRRNYHHLRRTKANVPSSSVTNPIE